MESGSTAQPLGRKLRLRCNLRFPSDGRLGHATSGPPASTRFQPAEGRAMIELARPIIGESLDLERQAELPDEAVVLFRALMIVVVGNLLGEGAGMRQLLPKLWFWFGD
ncbi:MAG: hypothetical protein ACXW0T_05025 [Methylobacter sp.]